MNTMLFKYAVEVEKSGSITQAADNLFMAQPNLSKGIKELENSLGIKIFKRTSKGMSPTKKGSKFLSYAKNIMAQIEMMEALHLPDEPGKQVFNVTYPHGGYISNAVSRFISELDSDRSISIKLQETSSTQSICQVADGQFNLGIIRYQPSYEEYFLNFLAEKNLNYKLIWEFEYLALMPRNHRLAAAESFTFDDLSDSIEVVYGDLVIPHFTDINGIAQAQEHTVNKKINLFQRGHPFDILMNIPASYMWVPPVPEELLCLYGLVQRRCERVNNCFKDMLIYRDGYAFSDLDKRFIDQVYYWKNEVDLRKYC
jgi:DNA-binding transcriptional LysR family regulator